MFARCRRVNAAVRLNLRNPDPNPKP